MARCCRTRSRTSISIYGRTDKFGLPQARRHVRWGENERGAVQRHGALEPGDAREGRRGDPDGAGRPGAEPRAGRLPDGPRSADRRWSTPTAGRTTCRISTWWTAACSRRRRRRTRRTRSWRWRRAPPSTSPTGCEEVSCDRDPATGAEDARRHRRHVRLSVRRRRALRPARARRTLAQAPARRAVHAGVLHAGRIRARSRG